VGLKRRQAVRQAQRPRLSAEPLVGLKLLCYCCGHRLRVLSAEPLVGLKHPRGVRRRDRPRPFSRTPRGFEA